MTTDHRALQQDVAMSTLQLFDSTITSQAKKQNVHMERYLFFLFLGIKSPEASIQLRKKSQRLPSL